MPELPEVETIVRELCAGSPGRGPSVVGRKITSVTLRWRRHVAMPSPRQFAEHIRGQRIESVERRGKYLVFNLTRETLLIHLKMSGDLSVVPRAAPRDKHAHTVFHLSGGYDLRFSDTRKFGRVYLVSRVDEVTGRLGPEPLARNFTASQFARMLAERRRLLKPLLLDQAFIAGVGNIYADEALHRARLHPLRRSSTLRPEEVARLWRGIRDALRAGIRHEGASIDRVYRGGGFQNHFRVYDREGEPCPNCGTPIRKMIVGQRGTHYCSRCQRRR